MIDFKTFLSKFQINYFDYKQESLSYILVNHSNLNLKDKIIGYNKDEYINAIKGDIRQTYFQAIETFFEIFFILLPTVEGKINYNIIENLGPKNNTYSKIRGIHESDNINNLLDAEITFKGEKTISLGEFIFYFNLHNETKFKEQISESLFAIKYAIKLLAKDLSDRSEYNSYKHGLRVMPFLSDLAISEIDSNKDSLNWDISDSMTYYTYDKEKQTGIYTTRLFDTKRDLKMTSLCSNLLWLMIRLRDSSFNKASKNNKSIVEVLFFDKESIEKAAKPNVKIQNIKMTY